MLNAVSEMDNKKILLQVLKRLGLEIPGFFFLLSLVEFLVYDSLSGWMGSLPLPFPHPYWIGILVFALMYGLIPGLVSGVAAAGLLVYFSPIQFGANPLHWGEKSILPALFVIVGALIGVISMFHKNRTQDLEEENSKLNDQIKQLNLITGRLTRSNLNLEKKIVFRLETFQSVYEIAEKLNKLHLDQLYDAIPQLVSKYFKAQSCSFFLLETDGSLALKSEHGWSEDQQYPRVYESKSALIETLFQLDESAVITMETLMDLKVDAFFAVALITPDKKPLGMIKIESIDFLNVTEDNLRFLSMLSKWFMQSIVNGIRYAEKEKESTFEPGTGLIREEAYWFLVKKMVASAVRHKYEIVLLCLTLDFPISVGTIQKNILINKMGNILKNVCRIDDEVGIADVERPYSFLLMMPYTTKHQAEVVIEKVTKSVQDNLQNSYSYMGDNSFLFWEILSLEDGTLFLSEMVQLMIFDPILAGKR
jgi:GAF domain-containing protein